ncbi:MAG: succinate dehydrogenase cytochrome b subunit [Chloroflexi bacterium]|nr:succinate dehydrogenase cytochrome b subunit [Chloroflexota bacterium]
MAGQGNPVPSGRMTPYTPKPFPTVDGAVQHRAFIWSSIGTKIILAITGIGLALFLPVHLAGNLLLFAGAESFNRYAHKLISIPVLVPIVEIGLLALFIIHSVKALMNFLANRKARPTRYAARQWAGGRSHKTWASTTMIISGLSLGAFVPIHLIQMKYGPYFETKVDGETVRDVYKVVVETFANPLNVAFYLFCMAVVGMHLYHGFASAFSSLGVSHPRYSPVILWVGRLFGAVIGLGFFVLPIYAAVVG